MTTTQSPTAPTGLDFTSTLTDVGNAARFITAARETLRYAYARNQWFIWTGVRWQPEAIGEVMALAKQTARAILAEAKDRPDHEPLKKHALHSQRRERIHAMIDLAKPDLAVAPDTLDRNPWLFNTLTGAIDLRTGKLRPHDPRDLITKLAPVEYDPRAKAPKWQTFLNQIFNSDQSLITYAKRFHGHALTGDITEQFMPVYNGSGANGKSTLLETIAHVMGDYCDTAPPDLLLQRSGSEHPTELADLMGKRLVIASETERNRKLRLQLVKRLTGDAALKARFMRQDYFNFKRTFKIVLVTNNRPRVDEDSEAIWRRLRLLPFDVVIPAKQRDHKLAEKLRAESAGILNWLLEGCLEWRRLGLTEPTAVTRATDGYRAESDPLADFFEDCCTLKPSAWTSSFDLRANYERHCAEHGDHPMTGRDFTDLLKHKGFHPQRRRHTRGWAGIALTQTADLEL